MGLDGKTTGTGSTGGLSPKNMGGRGARAPASPLESDVSGHNIPGKATKGGMGGKSPSADKVAAQAASAGRISTPGQARGGPQSQGGQTNTPSGGTGGG